MVIIAVYGIYVILGRIFLSSVPRNLKT